MFNFVFSIFLFRFSIPKFTLFASLNLVINFLGFLFSCTVCLNFIFFKVTFEINLRFIVNVKGLQPLALNDFSALYLIVFNLH